MSNWRREQTIKRREELHLKESARRRRSAREEASDPKVAPLVNARPAATELVVPAVVVVVLDDATTAEVAAPVPTAAVLATYI